MACSATLSHTDRLPPPAPEERARDRKLSVGSTAPLSSLLRGSDLGLLGTVGGSELITAMVKLMSFLCDDTFARAHVS